MTDPGETVMAPKGNAKTLRQKDRVTTILCRVGFPTPKVQPVFKPGISQVFWQRHARFG